MITDKHHHALIAYVATLRENLDTYTHRELKTWLAQLHDELNRHPPGADTTAPAFSLNRRAGGGYYLYPANAPAWQLCRDMGTQPRVGNFATPADAHTRARQNNWTLANPHQEE